MPADRNRPLHHAAKKKTGKSVFSLVSPLPGATTSLQPTSMTLKTQALQKKRELVLEHQRLELLGLGDESRASLADLQGDSSPVGANLGSVDDSFNVSNGLEDEGNVTDDRTSVDTTFVHALKDMVDSGWIGRRYDTRTWKYRREGEFKQWDDCLPPIIEGFIQWKWPLTSTTRPPVSPNSTMANPREGYVQYTITVYDLWTVEDQLTIWRSPDSTSPAVDFMAYGYLVKTPKAPTSAIAIRTLDLFHRIRQRKPSFSVEAFAKVICDYYMTKSTASLASVYRILTETYEIYLRILIAVDKRVHSALGWDTADWRVKNACRACCYKLEDEPPMRFSRLWAFDGNNSLKRMHMLESRIVADSRTFDQSDYYIPTSFVDQFSNEVQRKPPPVDNTLDYTSTLGDEEEDKDDDGLVDDGDEGDPTDGNDNDTLRQCVRNWKSAASEEKKKMWAIFDETGIFASACRHGLILWIIDMVRSGELAKYPLAIVSKVVELLEPHSLGGYDIGCSFQETIKKSSLGPKFSSHGSKLCVNAFHGYIHCYQCQLVHHPSVIQGTGLEDLETLERVFSASNELASITRYASRYRRRLYIHFYFKQWDEDKYANSGTFILNNLKQAYKIIDEDTIALKDSMAKSNPPIFDHDLDTWEKEEVAFFATLGEEREWNIHAMAYVELLQDLQVLERQRSNATSRFVTFVPSDYMFSADRASSYTRDASTTARLETQRRQVNERYDRVMHDLISLEVHLGIHDATQRWTPSTPEYAQTLKYISERRYQKALNRLHRLVILRLFELHRLNLSHTGYKLRTHISKSLQTQCKTIRRAVDAYNTAATALDRPTLDWEKVSNYSFVEEFTLLQNTRNDIREKPWATPLHRELIKLRRRITRAHEEVLRCKVEIRRMHTAIRDEHRLFSSTLTRLSAAHDPIYGAVKDFISRRQAINYKILQRVQQVYSLKEFDGETTAGRRVGGAALGEEGNSELGPDPVLSSVNGPEDQEELPVDDEFCDNVGALLQYFDGLSVSTVK